MKDSLQPVSYPHLDVYKRQGRQDQCQAFGGFFPVTLIDDEQKAKPGTDADIPVALQHPCKGHKNRDDDDGVRGLQQPQKAVDQAFKHIGCLLYTSNTRSRRCSGCKVHPEDVA